MGSLADLLEALRARRERRSRREQLRRELGEYRTPRERQELQDMCQRFGTTVEDLLADPDPPVYRPVPRRDWEKEWNEIVLHFSDEDDG